MSFNHNEIEQKWQKKWEEEKCFHAKIDLNKKKFYALDMFPYPSGAGLHVGHLASYTPTDIVSRYKRAQGFNVLHPMGLRCFWSSRRTIRHTNRHSPCRNNKESYP